MKAGLTIVIPPMEALLQDLNHWQGRAMEVLRTHGLEKADFEELLPQRVRPHQASASALGRLLQQDEDELSASDLDAALHGLSAARRKRLMQPKRRVPTFDDVDIALLSRFGGAKSAGMEWPQFGLYIEFWSAVFCLRMIYFLRFSKGKTEAEWWRASFEIAKRYANMEAAVAWAAGMGSKAGGKSLKPSRKSVSDEELRALMAKTDGTAKALAPLMGMKEKSVQKRLRDLKSEASRE